ncbi:13597_t:CDS:2 [Acaulospora colombiana]|uniref:13597_t:CDS:1 n=1 Tax=Acaulospora colombiana TaxID=27376 RepID=A0ACA9L5L0_9GLOM|nr:13597_t:CDS:2 [Acaulospora colombiana]
MWKISVPINDIAGLKRVLAEIDDYTEMEVGQGIVPTFGDDLGNENNVQVLMGKSATTDMEKMMKKIVEMALTKNKAQVQEQFDGIENKIQDLTNLVESKSFDRKVDKELWAIEIDDELWVKHPYKNNNDKSKEREKRVDIGCAVTNISGAGFLTVVFLNDRNEQNIYFL